ncbi:MAG: PadR family transcriptional regulator [Anaerolineae bacterium]
MSLGHAILGFLQVMPMTGYDLKTQAFDRTVTHFWSAVQQQIYRELDKMTESGWIDFEIEVQMERPSRKVYHITEAGRTELAGWLTQQQPLVQHREAFLIQLFFAAQLSNEQIIDLLQGQLVGHRERLAALRTIQIPSAADPIQLRRQTLAQLTLDMGLRLEQMYVDWLTDAIEIVQALP